MLGHLIKNCWFLCLIFLGACSNEQGKQKDQNKKQGQHKKQEQHKKHDKYERESGFPVPRGSSLIGKKAQDSTSVIIEYLWSKDYGRKIKACNLDLSISLKQQTKRSGCFGTHFRDAAIYDEHLQEGISPSYQGMVIIKIRHSFSIPFEDITESKFSHEPITEEEFLEKLKKDFQESNRNDD